MSQNLSRTRIIRSLGEALEWSEKEIGRGGSRGGLNHLTGRIGELQAAMVTRGQMALATNKRGQDVASLIGERISVKTVASSGRVNFRSGTFDQTGPEPHRPRRCEGVRGRCRRRRLPVAELGEPQETGTAVHGKHRIVQYGNGTILVKTDGLVQDVAKPVLRAVARDVGVDILNASGNRKNTRSLGADIIRSMR